MPIPIYFRFVVFNSHYFLFLLFVFGLLLFFWSLYYLFILFDLRHLNLFSSFELGRLVFFLPSSSFWFLSYLRFIRFLSLLFLLILDILLFSVPLLYLLCQSLKHWILIRLRWIFDIRLLSRQLWNMIELCFKNFIHLMILV